MYNTRFEEYSSKVDAPYVLNVNLERTHEKFSRESNWHEDIEIEVCTDGEGEILINGEVLPFRKGEVAVINSNYIHHTGTKSRIVYDCLIIKSWFLKDNGINTEGIKFKSKFQSCVVEELINELKDAYNDNTHCRIAKQNMILLKLIIYIYENYSEYVNNDIGCSKSFTRVRKVIKLIRSDFSKKILLDDISRQLCCDKYALCRDFKRITGQSIIKYLNQYRCQKAIEYIKEGVSVNEAAYLCGFDSPSFFTKTFKTMTGNLPSSHKK